MVTFKYSSKFSEPNWKDPIKIHVKLNEIIANGGYFLLTRYFSVKNQSKCVQVFVGDILNMNTNKFDNEAGSGGLKSKKIPL